MRIAVIIAAVTMSEQESRADINAHHRHHDEQARATALPPLLSRQASKSQRLAPIVVVVAITTSEGETTRIAVVVVAITTSKREPRADIHARCSRHDKQVRANAPPPRLLLLPS